MNKIYFHARFYSMASRQFYTISWFKTSEQIQSRLVINEMHMDKFPSVYCCTKVKHGATIVPVFFFCLQKPWQTTLKTQLPVQTLSAAAHTPHFYDTRSSQLFIA